MVYKVVLSIEHVLNFLLIKDKLRNPYTNKAVVKVKTKEARGNTRISLQFIDDDISNDIKNKWARPEVEIRPQLSIRV